MAVMVLIQAQFQPAVRYKIRHASSTPELRAAAYLRASSFYSYPEGRSEFAKRVR